MQLSRVSIDFTSKILPYPHQLDAINFLRQRNEVALFDEQGLGKTKIIIDTLTQDIRDRIIEGALIICKKSLLKMWVSEIKKNSHLTYSVIYGSSNDRGMGLTAWAHFYITTYETMASEIDRLRQMMQTMKLAIVLDESHRIKNPDGIATKAAFQLRSHSVKRILITGTPIANSPEDLWSQFYFLDGGTTFGTDFLEFKSKYCPSSPRSGLQEEDVKRLELLRQRLQPVSVRRLKNDVLELPDKVYESIGCELKDQQLEIYDKLSQELIIEIEAMDGELITKEINNILEKMLRLVQIASNPETIDPSLKVNLAKIPILQNLVESILQRNEKTIIWTNFIGTISKLKALFLDNNPLIIHGGIPIRERDANVDLFQKKDSLPILIANPAAAREGLTLTAANNAIYYDRTFNLVDYLQSQDRIHRISQTRTCHIYKLIATGTIDEYIEEILNRKAAIAGFVQGDKTETRLMDSFSKEDLLRYLRGTRRK